MLLVESVSQHLSEKQFDDTLNANVIQMHSKLKIHGPQLEIIFKGITIYRLASFSFQHYQNTLFIIIIIKIKYCLIITTFSYILKYVGGYYVCKALFFNSLGFGFFLNLAYCLSH